MNIFKRIASLWTLSPEAQQVQQELQQKVYMPVEPDYTAKLISSKGFTSLNDHQIVDYRYATIMPVEDRLPLEDRAIDIDPSKPLEEELHRARRAINMRAFKHRQRRREMEARMEEEWNNLQPVDTDGQDELDKMAEALTNAKPRTKRGVH